MYHKAYDTDATTYPKSGTISGVHEKADFFEAYSTPEGFLL